MGKDLLQLVYSEEGKSKINNDISFISHYAGGAIHRPARFGVFVIGGSLGLSVAVSKRANFKLSFSEMTFPHQMMRVILLEQVYRAFKIIRNEAYHK